MTEFTASVLTLVELLANKQYYLASTHPDLNTDLIHRYRDRLNWRLICRHQLLSETFLVHHCLYLDWPAVSRYQRLSIVFMRAFADHLDWRLISRYQGLTDEALVTFRQCLDSGELLLNKSVSAKQVQLLFTTSLDSSDASSAHSELGSAAAIITSLQNAATWGVEIPLHKSGSHQPDHLIHHFNLAYEQFMNLFCHFLKIVSPTTSEQMKRFYRLREIITIIHGVVSNNPSELIRVRHMTEYYLPTLSELLSLYGIIQPVKSSRSVTVQNDILGVFEPVLQAFETLLDNLYEKTALLVAVEVSVLHTVLKQDGLLSDFDLSKKSNSEETEEHNDPK